MFDDSILMFDGESPCLIIKSALLVVKSSLWMVKSSFLWFITSTNNSRRCPPGSPAPRSLDQLRLIAELLQGVCQHVEGQQDLSLRSGFEFAAFEVLQDVFWCWILEELLHCLTKENLSIIDLYIILYIV